MSKYIKNIIGLPALITHELMHLIFVKLTRCKDSIIMCKMYNKEEFDLEMMVCFEKPDKYYKDLLISIAPLFGFFLWILPIFIFGLGFITFSLFTYAVFYSKILLPSERDLEVLNDEYINIYKKTKEEF